MESQGHGLSVIESEDWDEHYGPTILAEFKDLAAAQAKQAERIATRAQQIAGFVVAVFAVAQTAALSSFSSSSLSSADKHAVLIVAIVGAGFVGFAGISSLFAGLLSKYPAVGHEDVEAAAEAADDGHDVAVVLARRYQRQLKEGEKVLAHKRIWLRLTEGFAVLALIAIVGEVVVALATRV